MSQPGLLLAARVLERYQRPLTRLAGALVAGAEALLHPLLILPLIIAPATRSWAVLGALVAAVSVAWLLPQLIASPSAWRGLPPNWPSWLLAVRAGLGLLLALVLATLGRAGGPLTLLALALVAFWAVGGVLAVGQPAGLLTDTDDLPPTAHETFVLWGGALAVLAGLLATRWLGPDGPAYPGWAVVLALVGAVGLAVAAALGWRRAVAPWQVSSPAWPRLPLALALLVHGPRLQRYALFRALVGLSALADPFLVVYAMTALTLPLQSAGIFLALYALVRLAAGLAYPALVGAGHARVIAQTASLARVVVPLLTLSLPLVLHSGPVSRTAASLTWVGPVAFGGLIVLYALAAAGIESADAAYFRDALASAHRPALRGLLLAMLSLLSLAFVVGGAIGDRWGPDALLLVATAAGLLTVLAGGLLLDVPPDETRDLTGTGALPTFREPGEW